MALDPDTLEEQIPFIEIFGNFLIFLLVFGMAATVDLGSIEEQLKNRNAIVIGLLLQFVFLPFFGFAAVNILDLEKAMGITLLVITSSPGGSYSNWWCSIFNGDLALSVTMTSISSLVSLIVLPLNLFMYASLTYGINMMEQLDWGAFTSSIMVIFLANFFGLCFSATVESQQFRKLAHALGNIAGVCLVFFSSRIRTNEEQTYLLHRPWVFFFGVAFPCVFGLIISNVISRYCDLAKPERVTVTIECCYQNIGIAISVALAMFKGTDLSHALCVPLYYAIVEATIVCIYCFMTWRKGWTKAPRDGDLFTVMFTSYELQNTDPPRDLYEILA